MGGLKGILAVFMECRGIRGGSIVPGVMSGGEGSQYCLEKGSIDFNVASTHNVSTVFMGFKGSTKGNRRILSYHG